jgi:hypothetical protein
MRKHTVRCLFVVLRLCIFTCEVYCTNLTSTVVILTAGNICDVDAYAETSASRCAVAVAYALCNA